MTRACTLVVNPAAGGGRAERLLPVAVRVLDEAGVRHEVRPCTSLEHARELAIAAVHRDQVAVAVGGDGLAGALAGTVAAAGGVFGIIPSGRGNDFARTLGIPFTPDGAAGLIASGREQAVDLIAVGRADSGTPDPVAPGPGEVVVAGSVYLGIPAVAAEIAAHATMPPGELAYPAAALRAVAGWRTATFHLDLDLDGRPAGNRAAGPAAGQAVSREFAGGAVVVANSRYFGAGMMVAPSAEVSDGLLDVIYIQGSSKLAMIHALTKIKKGTHVSMRPIGTARAQQVTVTAGRAMPGGADGEPLPCASPLPPGSPLRIRALPGALRMIL